MQSLRGRAPNTMCESCKLKGNGFLCNLGNEAAKEFESIKFSSFYPAGSLLFFEHEPVRGIFLVCSGKVKLSVSSKGGKTLILQLARPGEIIGLSASMSGVPYEVSAETLYPSQVAFIRREDFLRFIHRYPEVYQAVIRQLNSQYMHACEQLRTVGLSTSVHEKLARLFLNWSSDEKQSSPAGQIKMPLTHEQIAECVGSTRETITRTLSEFKHKHLVMLKGTTVMIPDRAALRAISGD
ncbi:MAG TPA: Crp/Fnr family transcriptional regulator [Acidobacteriaceae bacterium]|nr:Crp/Fnr family transcriptional regulator [Acidobacteriaceae bacterium]